MVEQSICVDTEEFSLSGKPTRSVHHLFAQQRREILPGVLRKLFAESGEDYRAKAFDPGQLPQFKRVLALAAEPEVRRRGGR